MNFGLYIGHYGEYMLYNQLSVFLVVRLDDGDLLYGFLFHFITAAAVRAQSLKRPEEKVRAGQNRSYNINNHGFLSIWVVHFRKSISV